MWKGVVTMEKFTNKLKQFMMGRYGVDQLSMALLILTLILSLLNGFIGGVLLKLLTITAIILCYFRILSKNLYKRQQENFKFLRLWHPIKNAYLRKWNRLKGMKTHKYFKCPKCKQTLRVPRGKGKICITCPKCKHELHKRT